LVHESNDISSELKSAGDQVASISSREEFATFVATLRTALLAHPEEWENMTLERYLDALGSLTGSLDGYFKNVKDTDVPEPSWSLFAHILRAAVIYE
jgi:hypothetical protein